MNISTHSLTKRLTLFRLYSDLEAINFNSQPHEEADIIIFQLETNRNISTHSLTKRLTEMFEKEIDEIYISTHSLTKRLTRPRHCIQPKCKRFQLTASRRG